MFTDNRFQNISTEGKVLYGLLLDRVSLSMENGWIDDEGRVYIIFTLTTIRQAMNCAEKSAIKYLTELEEFGLIERIRQGFGKPALIYVKNFIDQQNLQVKTSKNYSSPPVNVTGQDLYNLQPNYTYNNNTDFNNTNPNIGLYLGGENKSFRKYPDNHSIRLLELLAEKNYNLILIGDQNDNIKHQEYIATVRKENIINLSGSTSLEDFFNTIAHLNLLITIDSSAMHIAAALKVPFIALLGLSTSPTSTIIPKVPLGRILKIENNLIREEDYIRNITPDLILKTISELI